MDVLRSIVHAVIICNPIQFLLDAFQGFGARFGATEAQEPHQQEPGTLTFQNHDLVQQNEALRQEVRRLSVRRLSRSNQFQVEAQERLRQNQITLTSRNDELVQQNEALRRDLLRLSRSNELLEAQERLQPNRIALISQNIDLVRQNEDLKRDLRRLSQSNELLEAKLNDIQRQLCAELEGNGSYLDGSATPSLVESTLNILRVTVSCLAKLFVDLMRSHGVDYEQALMAHFHGIYLTRPAHISYLLRAWIHSKLFGDFENDSFLPGGPTLFVDSNQRKLRSFEDFQRVLGADSTLDSFVLECDSGALWRRKLRSFLALWQSVLLPNQGQTRRGDLFYIHDDFSLADVEALEPKTRKFIQGFLSAASFAWALHKLCHSFEPCARICRVQEGAEFKEEYMDSVVSEGEDPKFVSEVGFMICPGFLVRKSVVKCQTYLRGA